jgi:nuclear receptor interaction protein
VPDSDGRCEDADHVMEQEGAERHSLHDTCGDDDEDDDDDHDDKRDMERRGTAQAAHAMRERHKHHDGVDTDGAHGERRDGRALSEDEEGCRLRKRHHAASSTATRVASECHVESRFVQRYTGHSNIHTDIKEAVFFGPNDEFVVAGSDDGNVFVWETSTGILVRVLVNADSDIVNCVQVRMHAPVHVRLVQYRQPLEACLVTVAVAFLALLSRSSVFCLVTYEYYKRWMSCRTCDMYLKLFFGSNLLLIKR